MKNIFKPRVLVLGKNGMLGSMVFSVLSKDKNFDTIGYSKFNLDAKVASVNTICTKIREFDWIINCIGIIKPSIDENDPASVENAILVNSLFPHKLVTAAKRVKSKVIQIETDCVYSGAKGRYIETDLHDCTDVYGKTKSLGEVSSDNIVHLRTSIIGPEREGHRSFMDWVLYQEKNVVVNGYPNHLWNGITTYHFAKICIGIIKNSTTLKGTIHLIPKDIVSKLQLVKLVASNFKRNDLKIISKIAPQKINRTLQTIYPKVNIELWKNIGYSEPPTISQMVKELRDYIL